MENKEPKIKILYEGSFCPPKNWATGEHDFIHLEKEKLFFCQNCGLCISYGEQNIEESNKINL